MKYETVKQYRFDTTRASQGLIDFAYGAATGIMLAVLFFLAL